MIWDNLPHTVSVYSSTNAADTAGGHATTYTLRSEGVACLISSSSAARAVFAQQGIACTHTIATQYTGTQRGDKVVAASGATYHVVSINTQEGVGGIDSFIMLGCEQQL